MTDHAVVIAGGGPTGLVLAAELALAGVDVAVVELRTSQDLVGSRARGLHSRTIEVLDQRGVADRFVSQGTRYPAVSFARVRLDVGDLPSRHNYLLGLLQHRFEEILTGWVAELAVPIHRGRIELGWTPRCPTWRRGFAETYSAIRVARARKPQPAAHPSHS